MIDRTWVVVMAGGRGTRFWPRSRRAMPKQCLVIEGSRTLLQATVQRVAPDIPPDQVLVVTGPDMASAVRAQLPEVPADNVLVEPSGRNTAPCIGWAAVEVERRGGRAMAVLPSDHRILDEEGFRRILRSCVQAAESTGRLVLLGQTPDRPHTGYGYLAMGEARGEHGGHPFFSVSRFIEKPGRARAEQLLEAGGVLWNGGMFVWTVAAIRRAYATYLPRSAAALQRLAAGAAVEEQWTELEATSIDFGVLERCGEELLAVPCDFGWSDLGSWTAVAEAMPQTELGAAVVEHPLAVDGGGHIVYAPDKLVATLGVEQLIIVQTDDAIMVCPRDCAQRVPELLRVLEERGLDRYL